MDGTIAHIFEKHNFVWSANRPLQTEYKNITVLSRIHCMKNLEI